MSLKQFAGNMNLRISQSIGICMSAVSYLLAFCFCGDMVIENWLKVNIIAYNSLWYHEHFPREIRRFYVLIEAFAQNPVKISGLGVMYCSMQSFVSVNYFKINKEIRERID